jgi:hypothetical protein
MVTFVNLKIKEYFNLCLLAKLRKGLTTKPKIQNQKSKLKNQKSKLKNQKSKLKNQKSKLKNGKSKIKT